MSRQMINIDTDDDWQDRQIMEIDDRQIDRQIDRSDRSDRQMIGRQD